MKRLFIFVLAATLCVAFTVPAMAKVRVSGWIGADFSYVSKDSENLAGGVVPGTTNLPDDLNTVNFSSPDIFNRIGVRYSNDDGSVIGVIELRGGMTTGTSDASLSWNYAYVMWRLNPIFRLQIGRQSQSFSINGPRVGALDWENNKTSFVGFGDIRGSSSRGAIKALVKFTDQVRLEFQLLDPDNDSASTNGRTPEQTIPRDAVNGPGGNSPEENTIPRIDVSLNIKVANFVIEPAFTWARQEYDQVAAGNDDSLDAVGFSLGVQAGFGPITLAGEVNVGQNLGESSYNLGSSIGISTARTYLDANGFTRIEDTDVLAFWLRASYNFGPATLSVAYGFHNSDNDGNPAVSRDAAEFDRSKQMLGAQMDIKLAKGWQVSPILVWQDWGDSEEVGAVTNIDFGTRVIGGVQFMLRF